MKVKMERDNLLLNCHVNLVYLCILMYKGDEALVSCGIMESLIRVINWYDNDDGQDHITVCFYLGN